VNDRLGTQPARSWEQAICCFATLAAIGGDRVPFDSGTRRIPSYVLNRPRLSLSVLILSRREIQEWRRIGRFRTRRTAGESGLV